MTEPTNFSTDVIIGGEKYKLYFDLNTYAAFEQVSGKFFPDFLFDLQAAIAAGTKSVPDPKDPSKFVNDVDAMAIIRKVSFNMLRYLIWAACHTYDQQNEAIWPMTLNQLGAKLSMTNLSSMLPKLVSGTTSNLPKAKESKEGDKVRPITEAPPTQETGGIASGASEEEILNSLEPISEG